jgi:integrase
LTLEKTDLARGKTRMKGKRRKKKELVPLAAVVVAAIHQYLPYSGSALRTLFQTRGQRGKNRNSALETRSVLRIIRKLGQPVGLHVWCHGLRHTSITASGRTRATRWPGPGQDSRP